MDIQDAQVSQILKHFYIYPTSPFGVNTLIVVSNKDNKSLSLLPLLFTLKLKKPKEAKDI